MSNRRIPFHGLLAVLLALMAQLGIGASVPRIDPIAQLIGAEILCHAADDAGGTPTPGPMHPPYCLMCPLCGVLHTPQATLVSNEMVLTPSAVVVSSLRTAAATDRAAVALPSLQPAPSTPDLLLSMSIGLAAASRFVFVSGASP